MDRQTARELLRPRLREYVQSVTDKHGGENTFNCPVCGSGTGKKGTAAFNIDGTGERWKCFSCDAGGDIFDLIGLMEDVQDYSKQLDIAADFFGVALDDRQQEAAPMPKQTQKQKAPATDHRAPAPVEVTADFSAEAAKAHEALMQTPQALQHFTDRGLSVETIKANRLGYAPAGYNDMIGNNAEYRTKSHKAALYRYIFPYFDPKGRCNYFVSEIADRGQIDDYNGKYRKIKGLTTPIYNERYLLQAEPPQVIFVCEGIFDALSVEEVGRHAVALVGTGYRRLVQLVNRHAPHCVFVIVPDGDKAGTEAADRLTKGLKEIGAVYIVTTPEGGKDCNEALQGRRAGFVQWVEQAEEAARAALDSADAEAAAAEEEQRAEYTKTATVNYIQDFLNGIADSVNTPYTPTGFPALDGILDGGLYSGLYVLGAISSLGKSTFLLQVADQIAAQGRDVLIFSLEMARTELMSKSISRLTLLDVLANGGDVKNAKTARGITTGSRYQHYSAAELDLIERATNQYAAYAGHIYIHEGVGDIGAAEIVEAVQRHTHFTGTAPVVVVDYVQILAPADVRASDKQNMDKAVLELKRLSRDYQTSVVCVSSLNRDNYDKPISMAAFKESGAIEYGADVLLGLQLKGTGTKDFNVDEAKQKNPREIELIVLKNRNGATGATVEYEYYPIFNYFKEKGKGAAKKAAKPEAVKTYSC